MEARREVFQNSPSADNSNDFDTKVPTQLGRWDVDVDLMFITSISVLTAIIRHWLRMEVKITTYKTIKFLKSTWDSVSQTTVIELGEPFGLLC